MGTILGLDGKPMASKDQTNHPALNPPSDGKTRAQRRQQERGEPDLKQMQQQVVQTCQAMLREAKIPAALVAYPKSKNGEPRETIFLSIDNHDLIIETLKRHKEEYGTTATEAHTEIPEEANNEEVEHPAPE